MPTTCPLCDRPNPAEALYCFYDGAALGDHARRGAPVAVGVEPFPSPFVFPSGRPCKNFDELVLACEANWEEACGLLREGLLESFFGGLGRSDLSWAARRCGEKADGDAGLDELLAKLPGDVRKPARLAVQPAEVNVGRVARGADHRFVIHLLNEGMGLIRGAISWAGPDWLALGEEGGPPDKVFQFRHDQAVTGRVVSRRLRAGSRAQEGRLVVESAAGSVTVAVRVEAPSVVPFGPGVLAGADSPRRLADLTRAAPREAAAFFENGAVARWYEANGWTYPVQGPPASGVAALQQFYEALGLAAPPRVELDRPSIHLEGPPGAALEASVVVQTSERRAVFAHAASAVPWMAVDRAVLAGRTARIPVRVPDVPDRPGEQLRGEVQVTANGNQRFTVPVTLNVLAAAAAPEIGRRRRPPRPPPATREEYATPPRAGRPGLLAWVLAGGFLLLAASAVAAVTAVVLLTPGAGPPSESVHSPPPARPDLPAAKVENTPPVQPPPAPAPREAPPDATDLARRLESDQAGERVAAVRALAALGPKGAPALHALLAAMKDGDADFRREALAALPKIGAPAPADADALAALLASDSPEIRLYALGALTALGADARPAAPAVSDALLDHDPAIRRRAADILGNLGAAAPGAARGRLIDALADADPAVGAAALAALPKLGPATAADAPHLQFMLQDRAETARRYAVAAFAEIGPDAADFAPYVAAATRDDSPRVRRGAVAALLAVAPAARVSAEAFAGAAADADPEVRKAAVAALARLDAAGPALPGLLRALGSDDEATAKAAAEALRAAHLGKKQIEEIAEEGLRKGNEAQRLRVMELLTPLGADAAPAVPGLCALARESRGKVRRQAVALLEKMGPAARKAGPTLDGLLDDEKFSVRLDAATALAAIEGPEAEQAIPMLIDALRVDRLDDEGQAAERDRAAEALGRIGEPAIKPLADAVENDFVGGGAGTEKGRINASARAAAAKALQAMGSAAKSPRAQSLLSKMLRFDPSPEVRAAANAAWTATHKGTAAN